MTTPAHSPLPWEVCKATTGEIAVGHVGAAMLVAKVVMQWTTTEPELYKHNAEFIVRACNVHYDLLAALKLAQAEIRHAPTCEETIDRAKWKCSCGFVRAYDAIDAAIAKAEGAQP